MSDHRKHVLPSNPTPAMIDALYGPWLSDSADKTRIRAYQKMLAVAPCGTCYGDELVCENHPATPWNDCECGGAGMPCPDCIGATAND